ncbi:acyltransferase [Peribacillus simplex]|uniref:acyltransferase n=1 Tax=Peribacillus simplex TaxID=1478 RepID=UPI003CEFBD0E
MGFINLLKKYMIKKQQHDEKFRKRLTYLYYYINKNKTKINGLNNIVTREGAYLSNSSIRISGNNNIIILGTGTRLVNARIVVQGDGHKVYIGNNCVLKKTLLWLEDKDCLIEIKTKTTIEEACISIMEVGSNITIGEDCMLSAGIDIRNSDSHSVIDIDTNKRINSAKDIRIGNHVWLGHSSQILKGAVIGDDSVVASRSIVTKKFPSNCIIAGIPGIIVKEKVTWDRDRI